MLDKTAETELCLRGREIITILKIHKTQDLPHSNVIAKFEIKRRFISASCFCATLFLIQATKSDKKRITKTIIS